MDMFAACVVSREVGLAVTFFALQAAGVVRGGQHFCLQQWAHFLGDIRKDSRERGAGPCVGSSVCLTVRLCFAVGCCLGS